MRTRADVVRLHASGFTAFLVGESLLRAPDPARALRQLLGQCPTEVKVCGITRDEDLDACAALGVDFIGLNFSPRSPRRVTLERAAELAERAAAFKGVVAVFAGNTADEVRDVFERVRPDVLQLTDPPDPSASWPAPVWQTVRVGRDDVSAASRWPGAALLFDTAVRGESGGTGQTFDWSVLDGVERDRPLVLAGGLRPGNVVDAVRRVRPDGVDVASGVESRPGVKDPALLAEFVTGVRGAGAVND